MRHASAGDVAGRGRRGFARLMVVAVASMLAFAAGLVTTGARAATHAPPLRHPAIVVFAEPTLPPAVVSVAAAPARLTKAEAAALRIRALAAEARSGKRIRASITQYCLQGTTRTDHPVREGILAADPRLFPLGSTVEVWVGRRSIGRFLVDDTGGLVKGATVDIWVPDCAAAIRFGRRRGAVVLR